MRRTAVLLVFLAFAFTASAAAQSTVSLRGNVGAAFFRSPDGLNNVLNSGVDLGLGTGLRVYRGLEVVLQGSYDRFTLNGDNIALLSDGLSVGTQVEGGALNVLNATIGLRYTLQTQSDARPYLSGGIGLYHSVLEETQIAANNESLPRRTTTSKGYHVALGSKFRVTDTYSFFFEPRYVVVDSGNSDLGTSTSTRYVTVRLGLDVGL